MKVRCSRLINPITHQPEPRSKWVSLGTVYHVLSVSMDERRTIFLRLVGDDGKTPALYDIGDFEIASPVIPPNWIVNYNKNGVFELCPASWSREGFWVRYFDGEGDARQEFEEERQRTIQSDP